jgi:hypothetical protein
MSKLYLEITADSRDSDYVTSRNEISTDLIMKFMPLIEAIKKQKGHNWNTTDYRGYENEPSIMYKEFMVKCLPENENEYECFNDLVTIFGQFVPYGENGVHTIKNINLIEVVKEERLL